MMKIITLLGSSRENSKTNEIISEWINGLKQVNIEIESAVITLNNVEIKNCTGCRYCYSTGMCNIRDDFGELLIKLDQADLIIFATPVYMNNVTGFMKGLLDRLSVHSHLMNFSGKLGCVLVTSASTGHEFTMNYLETMQLNFGIKNIGSYSYTLEMGDLNVFIQESKDSLITSLSKNYGYTNSSLEKIFLERSNQYSRNHLDDYEPFVYKHWMNEKVKSCKRFHDYSIRKLLPNNFEGKPQKLIANLENSEIELFLNNLYQSIWKQYYSETLDSAYFANVLLFLTEIYDLVNDHSEIEAFGYSICKRLKDKIEMEGISEEDIAMSVGFGLICFAVNQYHHKTGHLKKFSYLLNYNLLNHSAVLAKRYMEMADNTTVFQYDIMAGLSGSLYYLLDCQWEEDESEKLYTIVSFLISLSDDYLYNDQNIIKFHIKHENQYNEELKGRCRNGHINLGLSHGVLGPLVALSKAHSKGYTSEQLTEAINKLFQLYVDFEYEQEEILFWPGQLPYEDFVDKRVSISNVHKSSSWCYGNVSVVRGLEKVSEYMDWIHLKEKYKRALFRILDQEPSKFRLLSPSLCHGLSSVLAVGIGDKISTEKMSKEKMESLVSIILSVYDENNQKIALDSSLIRDEECRIEGYALDFSIFEGSLGIGITLIGFIKGSMFPAKLLLVD